MDAEVNDKGNQTKEHGPFAGAGFFRDLVVVSQARSAFIGGIRSSSALIDELIEYNRRTEAWHSKHVVDSLDRCYIGNKPGAVAWRLTASERAAERASASTFVNKLLPADLMRRDTDTVPLPPVRVFREWQSYHSVEAIKRHPHNRTFIVGGYSCPRQAGNIFHEYLSALLQAVATNRTFLWEHRRNEYWESLGENSEEACDRILQRASWIPSYKKWKRTLQLDPPFLMQHDYIRSTCPEMYQRLDRGERVADDLSEYQVIQPSGRMWGLHKKTEVWEGLLRVLDWYLKRLIGLVST